MVEGLLQNPIDSVNWRRHRSGCPHFRTRWLPENDVANGEPMYQVFCGMNTPPVTFEEQEKCLASKTRCWRVAEANRKRPGASRAAATAEIPLASVRRRKPA